MEIGAIIALIAALVNASREIMLQVTQLMALFTKMNTEGRTTLTEEEMAMLVSLRDQARTALQTAINNSPDPAPAVAPEAPH